MIKPESDRILPGFFFCFSEMYWRILGGGHMLSVETCTLNQTQLMWALGNKNFLIQITKILKLKCFFLFLIFLGYDSKVWTYTGGWGGAHFQGSSKSELLGPVEVNYYF